MKQLNLPNGFIALFLSALLPACTSPVQNIDGGKPKLASTPYYLSTQAMASFQLEPPAPIGSKTDLEDIATLLLEQKNRTSEDCARAAAEAEGPSNTPTYPESFGDIGPFPNPLPEQVRTFIIHIWSDAGIVSEAFKKKYNWPRAFSLDARIQPCLKKTSSPAFPSGHTLEARVFALVLSSIDPSKINTYIERARRIARDRVIAGLHRPSEITAGERLADQIYDNLIHSEKFREDLIQIKTLLNK